MQFHSPGTFAMMVLHQRRLALQGGIPRGLTPGVPGALPRGMVALGPHSEAGGADGDRGGIGSGSEDTYDRFLGMRSATDGSSVDSTEGDVSTGVDSALAQTASEVESGAAVCITSPAGPHFWLNSA